MEVNPLNEDSSKISVDDNGIITDEDGRYVTQLASVEAYTPDLRLESLRLAQDFHSKSGAFEAIKPGAPDVVKTAENFLKFLTDDGYDTEIPERQNRPTPEAKSSDGENDVAQVIILD